ncbi:hypothetical protein AZZ92_003328, partial [Escherichia coli]
IICCLFSVLQTIDNEMCKISCHATHF